MDLVKPKAGNGELKIAFIVSCFALTTHTIFVFYSNLA